MTNRSDDNTGTPAGKGALRRRLRAPVLGGMAALALAGCGTDSHSFKPGCPNVGIVRDLGTYRAAAPQATAVMTDIQAVCEYSDTGVAVRTALTIRATPEPGAASGRLPVTYFVAVVDPNRNILTKQTFPTAIDMPAGQVGFVVEDLNQFIPAPKTIDARWYEVLVGFELPPEQVETNRQVNSR